MCFGFGERVFAHDPGLSTVVVTAKADRVEATATFARKDVETILGGNKIVRVEQLSPLFPKILELQCDGRPIQPVDASARFDDKNNIEFDLSFITGVGQTLKFSAPLMASLPRGHRQFLSVSDNSGHKLVEQLLSADFNTTQVQRAAEPVSLLASILGFLKLGVEHILTGYDHLLFLFGLLIVTQRFTSALKIISCFTIAHSITLAAATLNIVRVPSSIVEPIIAASIAYIGIENLFHKGMPSWRWVLTFGFGLIHGLGFASALRDMGVGSNGSAIAVPLVCFNLGVELGQIAVTLLVLPVLWKLRTNPVFLRRWVPACSVAVALAGGYWLIQRVGF